MWATERKLKGDLPERGWCEKGWVGRKCPRRRDKLGSWRPAGRRTWRRPGQFWLGWFPSHCPHRFLLLQQRSQNLPQSLQPRPLGLSHPRAWKDCSWWGLSWASWSVPPSRTTPGRRVAWTSPMRSLGSVQSPAVNPGRSGRGHEVREERQCQGATPGWARQGSHPLLQLSLGVPALEVSAPLTWGPPTHCEPLSVNTRL